MSKRERPPMPTEARQSSPEEAFYSAHEESIENTAQMSHTSHTSGSPTEGSASVQRTNVTYRMDTDIQALVDQTRLAIGVQEGRVPSKSDVIELAVRRLAREYGLGRGGDQTG